MKELGRLCTGLYGYKPSVFLPKPGSKEIYQVRLSSLPLSTPYIATSLCKYAVAFPTSQRLKTQCDNMRIPTTSDLGSLKSTLASSDVIMDAIFGFSFKPPVRAPFDEVLPLLSESKLPIVSVDIPSGWDVESGRPSDPLLAGPTGTARERRKVDALDPDVLISLTAPKEGVRGYRGRHFLGGRFVPMSLDEKFGLNLPEYPGTDLVVELPAASENAANKL